MMRFADNPVITRVQDGTTYSSADMCASCRFALIRKGSINGFTETRCAAMQQTPIVPTKIASCSAYLEKGKMTLGEMIDVAWIVDSRGGKHIGFLSPEELDRRRNNCGSPDVTGRPFGF
jgi:hypothetical protein